MKTNYQNKVITNDDYKNKSIDERIDKVLKESINILNRYQKRIDSYKTKNGDN